MKNILIVSNNDMCRSRMAQEILNSFGRGMKISTAGILAGNSVPDVVCQVMEQNGYDFSRRKPCDVQPGALLHFAREAGYVVAERFAGADATAGGEAARVVEAVDDLLQPRLRHCVLGILGNLSEDVAAQFGEVLG